MNRRRQNDYEALLEEERLILDATETIQRLMDDKGVNRVELARRIGSTKGHVSQLLDGKRNMTLRTLSRVLGAVGHRGKIEAEPLDHRSNAPMPLYTQKVHAYISHHRMYTHSHWADDLNVLRSSLILPTDAASDLDEEFSELLQGAA